MSQSPSSGSASLLLAEEYFSAEDGRFLAAFRAVRRPKALAGFVDRWKHDVRLFARAQILAYFAQPLDCPCHNVVVKRWFKHAEAEGDDELMAAILVALDLSVRRVRKTKTRYNWQTREIWSEERLIVPRDVLPREMVRQARSPMTGKPISVPARLPRNGRVFTHRTRGYLRRRAWRYFRRLGYQHPERYVPGVARALLLYQDANLAHGENILDNWGLMQACFRGHPGLEFTAREVRLRPGTSINDLGPTPRFPALWKTAAAVPVLLSLVRLAGSRLVRLWAMQWLRQEHTARLPEVLPEDFFALLDHADEEVQQFAAGLLEASPAMGTLPLARWFTLLETRNLLALEAVCRAMQRHVAAERLALDDCVRLACAPSSPVARLGLAYLKARPIAAGEDRGKLADIAEAQCSATAGELADWALIWLGTKENYDRQNVLRLLDSRMAGVRQATWKWLVAESEGNRSPGYDDAGLWCRLLETPYDDLRLRLIDGLSQRSALPGTGPDDLAPVWCSVLLGVHRGGRQKIKATQQLARALADQQVHAERLLPVLVAAVRSVRGPEFRAGLSAMMAAVEARPELGTAVRELLPELHWEGP